MLSKQRISLVCTFIIFALATPRLLLAQSFTNPLRIPTPIDPYSIVVGDINGDGRPDILWGDTATTPLTMHILLAQTNGTYLPAANLTLPSPATTECLLADFNKDGHLDLACAGAYQLNMSVMVFLGNGDGTFQSPISTPVPIPGNGAYVAPLIYFARDLNGDGFPDLVIKDAESGNTQTLLGNGKGGFKPIALNPINNFSDNPIFADVNGDGIPDALWSVGPEVALGKGDGTFGPTTNYEQTTDALASCAFRDMDGDGHLDAVCGYANSNGGDITSGTELIILHGNPDGTFNTAPIASKAFDDVGTFLTPFLVADMNGDGIPDILAYSGDGIAVLLGGSNLTFSTPLHYAQAEVGPSDSAYTFYGSSFQDLNGDGIPDIVAGGPNGIYISFGKKDGSLASAFAPVVAEDIGYATVADFNGDGIPDVAATGDTAIKLSLGKGDGTFATPIALPNNNGAVNFSTPLSTMNAHILHGDFNDDGKQDLLAIGSPSIYQYDSYIMFGHGDGTFTAPMLIANSSLIFPMYAPIHDSAVVDINHDGRSDIMGVNNSATTSQAQILFSLSNGNGTFTQVSSSVPNEPEDTGFYYPNTFPALADFSHRGMLDAAYGSMNNAYVVKGHGDGTFDSTAATLPIPDVSGEPSLGAIDIATGDFDGDGNPDVVLLVQYGIGQYPYPSTVATAAWVYYGNGNGTFTAPTLVGTFDRNYTSIATSDLNGDGLTDIVLKTSGSLGGGNAVGVIDAQAGRTFGPEVNYIAGTGLSSLSIADVNKDGRPDLIFANGDFNVQASSVTVLLNEGGTAGGTTGGTSSATNTTLTCNPSTLSANSDSLFSATVTSASGIPTGSITFTDNGTLLSQPTLTDGAATYDFPARQRGSQTIVATYVPTGSFAASSASCVLTVNGITTHATLTVVPTVAAAGAPVTLTANVSADSSSRGFPSGDITFYNGTTVIDPTASLALGSASFTTTSLPPGIDYLTCTYSGPSTFAPSTCNVVPVTITATSAAITLTSSLNPAPYLTPITFTAQVAAGSGGTIIFNVNGQNITTTPNAAGTSTYTISTLSPGSYLITATWFASSSALGAEASLNQVVTVQATPPDFSLTGTNTTFQLNHSGTGNLLLASLGTFNGTVALTCDPPYPPGYTCKLQFSSVTLPLGFSTNVTYTLAPTYTASNQPLHRSTRIILASLFPFTLISLIGLARTRRRTPLRTLLALTCLAILASATTACGPDHFIPIDTGTYPITFTATGTNQGSTTPITHTLTLNATIAP